MKVAILSKRMMALPLDQKQLIGKKGNAIRMKICVGKCFLKKEVHQVFARRLLH